MNKCKLLITCANTNLQGRSKKYTECFDSVFFLKDKFVDINVLETVSIDNCDYYDKCVFKKEFSNIGNLHTDKGYNWLDHVKLFLEKNSHQHYIFLTGRYLLFNNYLINLVDSCDNYKLIAKNSADIYGKNDKGVHMFYFYFRKDIFIEFYKFCFSDQDRQTPIEWKLKKFMEKRNDCLIIPSSVLIGVEARISSGIIQKV